MVVLEFEDELAKIGATLSQAVAQTLEREQFIVSSTDDGYRVLGGSQFACDIGSARLLHELGFRYWSPQISHVPALSTLPEIKMEGEVVWRARLFQAYGHDRRENVVDGAGRKLQFDLDRWYKLTGMHSKYEPVGHAWRNIKLRLSRIGRCPDGLFDGDTLNLEHPLAVDLVVEDRVALLREQRAGDPDAYMVSIEASDGDQNSSDKFFAWANAVAQGCKAEIPDMWCGCYAYAGHRNPPSFAVADNLHVQVTTGFSTGDYADYDGLIAAWQKVCGRVGLREYVDVQSWFHSYPGQAQAVSPTYWNNTLSRRNESGINIWAAETTGNWICNLYGTQCLVELLLTGECDPERVADELRDQVFGGNQAARDLYTYWATKPALNPFLFRTSYDYVSEIDSDDLRDAVMLAWDRYNVGEDTSTYGSDEYVDLLEKTATIMPRDTVHSYAMQRRIANNAIINRYPDLWMFADPLPGWYFAGTEFTDEEFQSEHEQLREMTDVPESPSEFRLMPTGEPFAVAPYFVARKPALVHVIGPLNLHLGEQVVAYDEGCHRVTLQPGVRLEYCRGEGSAAIDVHPERGTDLGAIAGGHAWFWANNETVKVDGNPRFTVNVPARYDCTPATRDKGLAYTTVPGVQGNIVQVNGPNLRGVVSIWSDPPLIQLRRDVFVMPK